MPSWCSVLILVYYFRSLQAGECRWLQVFWWEIIASFLIQKWWLTKTQTLSCGNVPVLLWNSFGGKLLLSWKEIWVRNVSHFSRNWRVLGTMFNNHGGLNAVSGLGSKILASCLPGNCWLLICWLEEEQFLSAILLQQFLKYLTLSCFRAERSLMRMLVR